MEQQQQKESKQVFTNSSIPVPQLPPPKKIREDEEGHCWKNSTDNDIVEDSLQKNHQKLILARVTLL